jgi:Type I phosphodiesterase / nucleotide pyrophosphatase
MHKRFSLVAVVAASLVLGTSAQAGDGGWGDSSVKHVLLISIDGMHAVDFKNCAEGIAGANDGKPYCPNLAALAKDGVNYVAASTSKPSDSFPGLMSIVSGATPRTMGVYYDVAYDRSLDGPAVTTGNGNAAAPCDPTQPPTGYTTEYEEGLDIDQTLLNGGAPGASLTDGGIASLDPTKMDRDPKKGCAPVYPQDFVRTNTIFGVVHAAGGYVAWSDKHPAYSSVEGPGGKLDDFYSPEINSNVVPLPGVSTPAGMNCATVPDPGADLTSWTNSFQNVQCYDTLKANAVLNWIAGKDHLGKKNTKTPNIFGMNFQAVSVAQKLIENGVKGGYLDAAGTPSEAVLSNIEYVDDSIGEMVAELKHRGLLDSTLIIITAKHGQSPIDPNLFFPIPGHHTTNGLSPATVISNQLHAAMPPSEDPNGSGIGSTEDDVSLLWLTSPSYTDAAVALLEANTKTIGAGQIFYGPSVALNYNLGGLSPNDPRTPDIIVTPNVGVIYTGSAAKQEEHGGFAHDDTNVMLLLSNPAFKKRTVYSEVGTLQVAPSVLKALGLDPNKLDGVRLEGTGVLPGVDLDFSH